MNIAIFGATGGTGRRFVDQAVLAGHTVSALVRSPDRAGFPDVVRLVAGHVLDSPAVLETVNGADAVLSCLGVKPTATFMPRGRIVGPGMAQIVEAMGRRELRRLVAVSTYGAGDSWSRLSWSARLVMGGILWGELADKNAMETLVRGSGLDWTIVRPVNLMDGPPTGQCVIEPPQKLGFGDWISRGDVAAFLLQIIEGQVYSQRIVHLGGVSSRIPRSKLPAHRSAAS